jgi:GTP-binding protein
VIEYESVKLAKSSVKIADIVFIVLDASIAFDRQDLTLVSFAIDAGKIPVLVFNKWDLIKDKDKFLKDVEYRVSMNFAQIIGMECIFISAIDPKQKYDCFFSISKHLYNRAQQKISTSAVNKFIKIAQEKHSPPRIGNRKLRVKYALQVSKHPQKFFFFFSENSQNTSTYTKNTTGYLKFLRNFIAESFNLYGIPVFVYAKSTENPYNKKKK